MTFWTDIWHIVIGVIAGGLVTGSVMLLVEWWKNRNIANNWKRSLLVEVKQNYNRKKNEVEELDLRLIGTSPGVNIFDIYANTFNIFYSFLTSGQTLNNIQIMDKYSEYITKEVKQKFHNNLWFNRDYKPALLRGAKITPTSNNIPNFNSILKKEREQLKSIKEILDLLFKETKTKIKEES